MRKRSWIILGAAVLVMTAMFSGTAMAGSWQQDNVGWWWKDDDGSYPKSEWRWLDGDNNGVAECYYFNESGYMLADTQTPDNYRVNASGAWVEADGTVHTQAAVSGPASGSQTNQQADNVPQGWYQSEGEWRYRQGSKDLEGVWKTIDGSKYYFDDYGFMVTGFQEIDGDMYYFKSGGALQKKTFLLDGSYFIVDSKGRVTEEMSEDDYLYYRQSSNSSKSTGSSSGSNSTGSSNSSNSSNSNSSNSSNSTGSSYNSSSVSVDTDEYAYRVFELVNEERSEAGQETLSWNDSLADCAQVRAQELVEKFSHTRPDGSSCFTIMTANGFSYGYKGENIAMGQRSPEQVMNSWMNSSGHKANILSPNFAEIGVGCYYSNGTFYWVQMFFR